MRESIAWLSDLAGLAQVGFVTLAALASVLLWWTRWRRHRYTKVYFPKSVDDFIAHYARCIRGAQQLVCITSDGFNMSNPTSRARAAIMTDALDKFLENGGKVYRYQILSTMHLNWLPEIERMRKTYPEQFSTFYNPRFEKVGNFCVIDPGTRRTVYEYMLPKPGYLGQSTEPSDFGFVHGHQHKSDIAFKVFEEIRNASDTEEILGENVRPLAVELWGKRIGNDEPFDPEIIAAQRRGSSKFDEGILK